MEQFLHYLTNIETSQTDVDLVRFTISIFISIVFGLILNVLYNLYFKDNEPQDSSLARSLVLITPAMTAIFWMIQSSLVLSLGLMGSMSFVRFRTPVKRAEDISFIVVSIGVSIAIAIDVVPIAAILVGLIFLYTFGRNYSFKSLAKEKFAVITFNTKQNLHVEDILNKMRKLKIKEEFVSSRTYDGITSYVFNAKNVEQRAHDKIRDFFSSIDSEAHINIFFPNDRLGA